jgi:nucleoside-diphosphate-sugar epimerase|tara:strand:+ start:1803 stop:2663 length:861 start_codon:yes stop_codon:yes gene_type:complete
MIDKVSIYGGTGFIGSNYVNKFEDECTIIPREERAPRSSNVLYFISTVHNYNIFDKPLLDIETNLITLIETLEKCKSREDIVFNFVSSWFVYGKTQDLPAREDSHCNPTGFYSITKRAAEQMLVSYCETFNLKYRILRLGNVYGTGDVKASKQKNALQHLISEVVAGRDINLYDGGRNIRDFLHVEDACEAINLAIKKLPTNEVTNIGSGEPQDLISIMEHVRNKVNSRSRFNFVKPPEFHKIVQIKDMYLETSKLKSAGFKQKIGTYKGVDMLVDNLRRDAAYSR